MKLTGPGASGERRAVSADLALAHRRLDGHVVLMRGARWLDLWPLCDFGHASSHSPLGVRQSTQLSPMVHYRAEQERLLYAALRGDLPLGERTDVVQEFQRLFQLDQHGVSETPTEVDYERELRADADAFRGRSAELKQVKAVIKGVREGVFWLAGQACMGNLP
jgi:hypothetical protein